jgi:hypothetical protein
MIMIKRKGIFFIFRQDYRITGLDRIIEIMAAKLL